MQKIKQLKLAAVVGMLSLAGTVSAGIITISPNIHNFNKIDLHSSGQVLLRLGGA